MKKEKVSRKFYPLFFIIIASLFFGLGFVISQIIPGQQLATGPNIPNQGHPSEDILCNGCVKGVNVNQNEICTYISGVSSLGCPPSGGGGGGGIYFFQVLNIPPENPSIQSWIDVPGSISAGIDWNGRWVDLIAMPSNSITNNQFVQGEGFSLSQGYTIKGKHQDGASTPNYYEDHRVLQLDTSTTKIAYLNAIGNTQNLNIFIRVKPGSSTVLQVSNKYNTQNGAVYLIVRPLPNPA